MGRAGGGDRDEMPSAVVFARRRTCGCFSGGAAGHGRPAAVGGDRKTPA